MPLVSTCDIVIPAAGEGTGCGAFNAVALEHVSAIIAGAEAVRTPVILQVSHNAVRYHGALGPIGSALVAAARAARVPVAVHLDHAESAELVREAVALGFTSVMFDASTLDYADNVRATRAVVEHCHSNRVWVEAELGEVGGKDGVHAPGVRTDPEEAKTFVAETGVDCLAVAVGTSHAMTTRDARLDFDLITALRARVGVPLVLHGSSGVSDEHLTEAVRHGMTKINIATQLNRVFTEGVRGYLAERPEAIDPRRYLGAGRERVAAEVSRLLGLLSIRV
ncbi:MULTISPECIES: class II fructose-bisphosphate aldolase [Actinoalloteichus]|uniref:Ketose-bisphosphate aldolase n=1 Tax=Actinoalloteichus fjordicus TaxID=1612552 RepID=A0AAC9LGQ3_9PSEU|nr:MULTISPECIES: class II fructose-bisphosphate aldolase [Actinoalloteichus]APU15989.1 ketose-bisphosphate aldolase [Actinoalloteichus fjordicus]APU22053.1 ketose-bisphosphate aldolase [Actinoalloteichus sp. GBA129-24]